MENSGRRSRNKGANAEREAAQLWREAGYPLARRHLEQYRTRSGRDLENTGPFLVQTKIGARPNVWQALKEAEGEAKESELPVAMVRRDREDWIVAMSWKTFRALMGGKEESVAK
jgi:hypothetical protein